MNDVNANPTLYSSTEAGLQINYNNVKEIILQSLVREGFLKNEDADKFLQNYVVVVYRKGWFGRFYDKIFKTGDDATCVAIVKLI